MGVDQYFSSVVDYGFSKTREEALEKWNHDRVLSDSVRVIRLVRPLVITSVFVGRQAMGMGIIRWPGRWRRRLSSRRATPLNFPNRFVRGCGRGLR